MSELALVTGGTGLLGGNLLIHLLAKGFKVRGLFRSEPSVAHLRGFPIEWVMGDLEDKVSLERAFRGVDEGINQALEWFRKTGRL